MTLRHSARKFSFMLVPSNDPVESSGSDSTGFFYRMARKAMKNKTISIDYEYNDNRLVCCCTLDSEETEPRTWWLVGDEQTKELTDYLISHKDDRVLICHALEKAEGQALQRMSVNPAQFRWYDTYTVECIIQNCNNVDTKDTKSTIGKMLHGLSLVDLESRYLGAKDRSENKEDMRALIIADQDLEEHRQAILDYCATDIDGLRKIAEAQVKKYDDLLSHPWAMAYSFVTLDPIEDPDFEEIFIGLCDSVAILSKSAYKGIRMDNRVQRLRDKADVITNQMKLEFNQAYKSDDGSELFVKNKKGAWTRKAAVLESLLADLEKEIQVNNPTFSWPRSEKTGKLQLTKDITDREPFKSYPMIHRLREIDKFTKSFVNLKNFKGFDTGNIHSNPCHHMFGTQTGRCAARPSEGFAPLMNHTFRVMMNPRDPQHKLVSIDFTAEENALAGAWANDQNFKDCYAQKDFYIAAGQKFGIIPEGATKKSHPYQRESCKITCLSKNYGQGAAGLALRLNIPLDDAKDLCKRYDQTFGEYFNKRNLLTKVAEAKNNLVTVLMLPDGMPYIQWNTRKADALDEEDLREELKKWGVTGDLRLKRLTSLLNIPIQGSGTSVLRSIIKRLDAADFDIVCTIHDEAVLNILSDELDEKISEAKKIFSDAFHEFFPNDFIKVGEPEIREFDGKIISHEAMDNPTWEMLIRAGVFSEDEVELA